MFDEEPIDPDTPETIIVRKDRLAALSSEARLLLRCISDMPDDMFMSNGRFRLSIFREALIASKLWDRPTFEFAWNELWFFTIFILRKGE